MFEAKPVWYKRNDLGKVKFDLRETRDSLAALNDVVERVLVWAGAIQVFAPEPKAGFKLWDVAPLIVSKLQRDPDDAGHEFITLRPPLAGDAGAEAYRRLIVERDPGPGKPPPPDQAVFYKEIDNDLRPGAHKGLGKIVAAVHHAARIPAAGEQRAEG
jgi:hypothetical protein